MYVYVRGACPWLDEHLKTFIRRHVPDAVFIDDMADFPPDADTQLQICDGWELQEHFAVINRAKNGVINAYPNSDALARKDYLSQAVDFWAAKRPGSKLRQHVPATVRLSLDYAEYVDEALAATDDLTLLRSLEDNANKPPSERQWWILKPALVDCGAGIRLFSTIEELAGHLELAEYEIDSDEEEEVEDVEAEREEEEKEDANQPPFTPTLTTPGLDALDVLVTTTGKLSLSSTRVSRPKRPKYVFKANGRIPSAQMRAFVAQQYILHVPRMDGRKWHVRAYVLPIGRLRVHVYREMLTLLAAEEYKYPWEEGASLRAFLTNTALHLSDEEVLGRESMREFWKDTTVVDDGVLGDPKEWKQKVWEQVCKISGEVFRAAAHTMADKFTTMEKCYELFALDFLVDVTGNVWLLEANETPAFYEQGVAGPMAKRLMESVMCVVMEHMGLAKMDEESHIEARKRMVLVLDETESLGKSNITEIVSEDCPWTA